MVIARSAPKSSVHRAAAGEFSAVPCNLFAVLLAERVAARSFGIDEHPEINLDTLCHPSLTSRWGK